MIQETHEKTIQFPCQIVTPNNPMCGPNKLGLAMYIGDELKHQLMAKLQDWQLDKTFQAVIDLAQIFSSEASLTRQDVMGARDSGHVQCIVLILKDRIVNTSQDQTHFRVLCSKDPSELLFPCITRQTKDPQNSFCLTTRVVKKVWLAKEQAAKEWQELLTSTTKC